MSFAPLAAAANLRELNIERIIAPNMCQQQLDQLRTLPHLRKMNVRRLAADSLVYLLRAPHFLQWQELHEVYDVGDEVVVALSTLPTLTSLFSQPRHGHCDGLV